MEGLHENPLVQILFAAHQILFWVGVLLVLQFGQNLHRIYFYFSIGELQIVFEIAFLQKFGNNLGFKPSNFTVCFHSLVQTGSLNLTHLHLQAQFFQVKCDHIVEIFLLPDHELNHL